MKPALQILAGPRALAHIREHGLAPEHIACIPAAAGGPKGLILRDLDKYLFGTWLPAAPRQRELIGASIGAWRMACGAASDPAAAFDDLARAYVEEQRYTAMPGQAEVSRVMRALLEGVVMKRREAMLTHPQHRLHVLANRGIGALAPERRNHKRGFASAAFANLRGRKHLAQHMERVVFHGHHGYAPLFGTRFDAFANHTVRMTEQNFGDAMMASGSIPLVVDAVRDIAGAPRGLYWDGGIIDYHLHLPYQKFDGLTLYPHFAASITPGWLDKFTPWRKASGAWLDTLVLLCPTPEFVASLPGGKIPDRSDFKKYGLNWQAREAAWRGAIEQSAALADAFNALVQTQRWGDSVQPIGQ